MGKKDYRCIVCDASIEPTINKDGTLRKNQRKHCSEKCKSADLKNNHENYCTVAWCESKAKNSMSKFCTRHYSQHLRLGKVVKTKQDAPNAKCLHCKNPTGGNYYCDTTCRYRHIHKVKETTVCTECGVEFPRYNNRTTCSQACRDKREDRRNKRVRIRRKKTTCVECGVCFVYETKSSHKKAYCSQTCLRAETKRKNDKERAIYEKEKAIRDRVRVETTGLSTIKRNIDNNKIECAHCKTPLIRRRVWNRYCGESCEADYMKERRRISYQTNGGGNHRGRAKKYGVGYTHMSLVSILERDKWTCHICGVKTPKKLRGTLDPRAPEVDHIIPLSVGGDHSWGNVACACRSCNGAKSNTPLGQVGFNFAV